MAFHKISHPKMLFIKLKLMGLKSKSHSPKMITKRLNAIGYVQNVSVDLEKKTISFEYTSHRDMDSAVAELRKMGLTIFKVHSAQDGIKNLKSKSHF